MGEKQPVTQPWPRLQVLWSQSVAFKCGPEGHFEAICPKYTPCTGARNQGANLFILSHLYWFILFFHFMFGSILVFHIRRMLNLISLLTGFWCIQNEIIIIRTNKRGVATQLWFKLHRSWNQLEEFKCVTGELLEVTWQKYMQWIGRLTAGIVG